MIYNVITIGIDQPTDDYSDGRGLLDRIEFDLESMLPEEMQLFPPAPDQIYIRPDWPPIGSPFFADRLRAWHIEHNAALISDD